jgi:indolepyruvate ferredoxin oxidoreductase alpha subunit
MTGGQDHPGTGKNLSQGQVVSNKIDIKKVVEGIGIDEIYIIDPYNYNAVYKTLKKALSSKNLNVIITKRPCILYPCKIDLGKKFKILEGCNGCNLCMQIGCPSILNSENFLDNNKPIPFIDSSCIGCSICKDICVFNFIEEIKN